MKAVKSAPTSPLRGPEVIWNEVDLERIATNKQNPSLTLHNRISSLNKAMRYNNLTIYYFQTAWTAVQLLLQEIK